MSTTGVNFLIQQRDNLDELFRKAKTGEIDKSKVFKNNNGDFDSFSSSSMITGTVSSFTPGPNTTEQFVQNVVYADNTQLYNIFECKLCKKNVIDTVFECGHCACAVCCYHLSAASDNDSAGTCHICSIEIKDPRRLKNDNISCNENNVVIN